MSILGTDVVYYQSSDVERAIEFYRDNTLGWELYGYYEDVKWAEFNAGNTTFAINDLSALDPEAEAQTGGGSVAFAVEKSGRVSRAASGQGRQGDGTDERIARLSLRRHHRPLPPYGNPIWLHNGKDGTFGD